MKKFIVLALCLITALTFGGCSLKGKKSADKMSEDTPWNRNIMETDSGYYYNSSWIGLSLRYIEKSNGTDIYLCAKPECSHEGEDTCTATYNNLPVSNFIKYDGNIYFVADTPTEDSLGVSLYKAYLDGSALDKVTDISKVKHANSEEELGCLQMTNSVDRFIIHKGYAYLTYNLGKNNDSSDFIESGFVRVNIQTGEVEKISFTNNYEENENIHVIAGIGDYVYYMLFVGEKNNLYRYNIKNGEREKVEGEVGKCLDIPFYCLNGITDNYIYLKHTQKYKDINEIVVFDINTLEPNGTVIKLPAESVFGYMTDLIRVYDNRIYTLSDTEVTVYSAENGELLGKDQWCNSPEKMKEVDEDGVLHSHVSLSSLDISDGKLYITLDGDLFLKGKDFEKIKNDKDKYDNWQHQVYCCPIDDVIAGTGKWEKAYAY